MIDGAVSDQMENEVFLVPIKRAAMIVTLVRSKWDGFCCATWWTRDTDRVASEGWKSATPAYCLCTLG